MRSTLMSHCRRPLLAAVLSVSAFAVQATETVNFGVQPATQPIYVARSAGLLDPIEAKYDVKIEFHSFSYGAPENQAMAAGDLDLASAGMGPAIVAAARLPAKLLGISILEQTAIIVPTGSPITAVTQLKGKRIAYPGQGSQQYPLLLKALKEAGLSEDDVELFKTKGSDVATLVESGGVDAGITWDPHVSRALASGKAKVLIKAEAILPLKSGHYIGNGVYGRTEFIDANPALVEDIMLAIIKAERLILADPGKAVGMWSEQIGFPPEVIDYALKEGISVYDEDVAATPEMIEKYVAFLKEAGILKPDDNPKLAPEFAQRALKRAQAE